MTRQYVTQGFGRALIEENTHLCGSKRTSSGVIEYGTGLFQRNTRKPLDELRHEGTVLKILKKRGYRHAGAAKYPRATDTFRVSLNRRASGPIDHNENGSTFPVTANVFCQTPLGRSRTRARLRGNDGGLCTSSFT